MTQKKRGLGKGLNELGLSELLGDLNVTAVATRDENGELKKLPIDVIQPGRYQPRRNIDQQQLAELADSITVQGIIQPIVVRNTPQNGRYEIIAGERRWRAAQMAGLAEVPVIIRDINDEAAIAMSLIENIQRQDLNVIEEALALQRLIDEFAMTHQEIAVAVGKSRASVTNILRLLKLNDDVRSSVEQGLLDMGHARALLALEGVKQSEVANHVIARNLSVRQTEQLIRQIQRDKQQTRSGGLVDPNVSQLQRNLSEKLGAHVAIKHNHKGKGKLIIHYNSIDELDGIIEHIQ